jgi:hypothetical protein
MTELQKLQATLATINAEIAKRKALDKLQKMPVRACTMHKYFDLQKAYVEACKK